MADDCCVFFFEKIFSENNYKIEELILIENQNLTSINHSKPKIVVSKLGKQI
jgi:hypothetical protein